MSETNLKKPTTNPFPTHYNVRVSVENFGPIEKGSVDLRPLTIFVGPSNTGKTYLAILIYALHKTLHGFPRLPFMERYFLLQEEDSSLADNEVKRLMNKIGDSETPIFFSDLPSIIRKSAQGFLQDGKFLADDLRRELERCFDLETISGLIRMADQNSNAKFSISVKEEENELWKFLMEVSASKIESNGKIEDIELFSRRNFKSKAEYRRIVERLRRSLRMLARTSQSRHFNFLFGELWDTLLYRNRDQQVETYYLPAARSGIMQSHRVIASSLVARSTRAGLERFPELPTFSGVMADFMQRLILYDVSGVPTGLMPSRKQIRSMKKLATELERGTLGGRIRTRRPSPGSYPEFVYRPSETNQDIRLSRASSMVSELAPVVLFIRGNIGSGDTLIIEEPEAHLHPAAQAEMAATLARLVNCGVRVVITTHSDWLLKEIGNLLREGELEEQADEQESDAPLITALRPQDVGVWLFQKDDMNQGSVVREIEFDRVEGVDPSDYEAVAEQLYNRSADLQNRLEEVTNMD